MNDKGERLHTILSEHFGEHPNIGDIRGRGLFFGLEFVMDRETKRPFPPGKGIPAKLKKAAMEHRLICYPGGGDVDGRTGAHILLAPPFIAEDHHFEQLAEKLTSIFSRVFGL